MVEKLKVPAFIKDGAKAALEPLNKLEDQVRDALKKVKEGNELPPTEVKKLLSEALKWIRGASSELEKSISDGMAKTLSLLNLPSREDLQKIDKRVASVTRDLKKLEIALGPKKTTVKKPAVKKPAVKKAPTKATKKAKAKK